MKKLICRTCEKEVKKDQESIDKHNHKEFLEIGICENCGDETTFNVYCSSCQILIDKIDIGIMRSKNDDTN